MNNRKLANLREIVRIQRHDGNWNYDSYMHGMANGMILSLAIMEGKSPDYINAPARWLKDDATATLKAQLEEEEA